MRRSREMQNVRAPMLTRHLLTVSALILLLGALAFAPLPSQQHPLRPADGRYVAFQSAASTLQPSGTTPCASSTSACEVYVRDRVAGTTTLVSQSGTGTVGGAGVSADAVISDDGRYVVFDSSAPDLVV